MLCSSVSRFPPSWAGMSLLPKVVSDYYYLLFYLSSFLPLFFLFYLSFADTRGIWVGADHSCLLIRCFWVRFCCILVGVGHTCRWIRNPISVLSQYLYCCTVFVLSFVCFCLYCPVAQGCASLMRPSSPVASGA